MGNYFDSIMEWVESAAYPLSYLSDDFSDVEAWQQKGREEVSKLLRYSPPSLPFDTQVHKTYEKDGLEYQHISYAQSIGPRAEGILMRPVNSTGKLPAILALHDHGAFKYYGKEKITALDVEYPLLKEFKDDYYGGRSWATEIAKRGYVVFVPDMLLWGSRKMNVEDVIENYVEDVVKHPTDTPEHINAYNIFAGQHETHIAKTLFKIGITWPGVMVYEDMRALDFLLSQPDVDPANVGCGGLSCGGLRTVYLAAMDPRIKCSVVAGFMSTTSELAGYKIGTHTWMLYTPGLTNLLDFPDLYSLHGAKPTMVLFDADDDLFTTKGQEDSNERLTQIYTKMGVPHLYRGHFFPGPHKFDVPMQEVAFAFYDEFMK